MPQLDNNVFPQIPQGQSQGQEPAKKAGFLGRLFGSKSKPAGPSRDLREAVGGKRPREKDFGQGHTGPKEFSNWEPLNVSGGVYRGKDLRLRKESFERHVRDDLRDTLSKFSKRNELAKALSAKRGNKLTKTEVREAIDNMYRDRKISSLTARKLRTKLGARKTSFF